MKMNIQFSDRDIEGFKFGQMTMTGYKYIVILDKDLPEYSWKAGDMIVVTEEDHPCFRIEPLFGVKTSMNSSNKLKSLKHTDRLRLDPEPYEAVKNNEAIAL